MHTSWIIFCKKSGRAVAQFGPKEAPPVTVLHTEQRRYEFGAARVCSFLAPACARNMLGSVGTTSLSPFGRSGSKRSGAFVCSHPKLVVHICICSFWSLDLVMLDATTRPSAPSSSRSTACRLVNSTSTEDQIRTTSRSHQRQKWVVVGDLV
jgi:hypothetical protein